jgi:hypothetical protein
LDAETAYLVAGLEAAERADELARSAAEEIDGAGIMSAGVVAGGGDDEVSGGERDNGVAEAVGGGGVGIEELGEGSGQDAAVFERLELEFAEARLFKPAQDGCLPCFSWPVLSWYMRPGGGAK